MGTFGRKRIGVVTTSAAALFALALTGIAGAHAPTVVRAGNLVLSFNGDISPTRLPRSKPAPISLQISGRIATADGSQPPALQEFILETDRNGRLDATGLPTCTGAQLEARDTKSVERVCGDAIVGTGSTDVQVTFPESQPIPIASKLLLVNGGVRGGTTTLYVHAFLTQPVSAAIVTTVKVTRVHSGRFGTRAVASIPVIAGGAGSVTSFSLKISRRFTHGGRRRSLLTAKCPDGRLEARGEAVFRDGTRAEGSVTRSCTPSA